MISFFIQYSLTSGKHVRAMNTPLNPTFFYSKTGVCRCMLICLNFATQHTLWVSTINVLSQHITISKSLSAEENLCILHGCVFVMKHKRNNDHDRNLFYI